LQTAAQKTATCQLNRGQEADDESRRTRRNIV
jgi:hypothetical protein